jgi:regulator of replication initiation timing
MNVGNAYVNIKAKTDDLGSGLSSAERNVETSSGKMRNSIAKIDFAAVALAATAFGVAVGYAMKQAVDAASDLQEVQNKFDVVFAGNTAQAESWAKVLQDSYAMSEREAKELLSTMQDLLVPMGVAPESAAALSDEIVRLSADIGSFNNQPTADVLRDISAAFAGSNETVRKYGVTLTEEAVAQKAVEMGLAATTKEVDQADKVLAKYKLILEGTTAAHGDNARSSDSYAMALKEMNRDIENAKAAMGASFIGVATNAAQSLSDLAKWAGDAWKAFDKLNQEYADNVIYRETEKQAKIIADLAVNERYLAAARKYGYQSLEKYKAENKELNTQLENSKKAVVALMNEEAALKTETKDLTKETGKYGDAIDGAAKSATASGTTQRTQIKYTKEKLDAFVRDGQAVGPDLWQYSADESEAASIRAINYVEDTGVAIKTLNKDGKAEYIDLWRTAGDEAEAARDRTADTFYDTLEGENGFKKMVEGFAAGWGDAERDQRSWAQTFYDIGDQAFGDVNDAMATTLVEGAKGNFDDIGDAWETTLDNLLYAIARKLSENAVTSALSGVSSAFSNLLATDTATTTGTAATGTAAAGTAAAGTAAAGTAATGTAAAGTAAAGTAAALSTALTPVGGMLPGGVHAAATGTALATAASLTGVGIIAGAAIMSMMETGSTYKAADAERQAAILAAARAGQFEIEAGTLASAIYGAQSFGTGFDMWSGLGYSSLEEILAYFDARALSESGEISDATSAYNDALDSYGGARAMGGDVFAGKYYWTGERGPELFAPPQDGTIIPNHMIKSMAHGGGIGDGAINNRPIILRVELNLDGRKIGETMLQLTKDGNKYVHERGITNV